jgi:thiamine pyrophosphate-dependent acetolactate synthase large subunit-like protein
LVVVANNSGLGMEMHHLVDKGYPEGEVRYANPSFKAVAESLGFEAATIREISDLDALRGKLSSLSRPMLLDCKIIWERLEAPVPKFARQRARRQNMKPQGKDPLDQPSRLA